MHILSKYTHNLSWQLLFLLSSFFYFISPGMVGVAHTQETLEAKEVVSKNPINQTTSRKSARPRPSFFEQDRRPRFGFGDFLNSALDGSDNYFAADSINNLSNVSNEALTNPLAQDLPGTLTVQSRNKNSNDFLRTTFVGQGSTRQGGQDIPVTVNLTFVQPRYGSDPRIGTITVSGTITVGGQTLSVNNIRSYNGSFSAKNQLVSGAIQVVDPSNPGTTFLMQLPPTIIPNVSNDNQPISAPATLSIGLPTDR